MTFVSVVLDLAIDKALDYSVPPEWQGKLLRGAHVEVPVRNKMHSGYVLELKESSCFSPVKPVHGILADADLIPPDLFDLALWMARYYCTPLRQVLKTILPASIRSHMEHKQQLFVMRLKTREELQEYCKEMRNRSPAQAAILDEMLLVKKGILLTELLEKSKASRSSVKSLIAKGLLQVDSVRIDRSPLEGAEYCRTKPKKLNPEQAKALQEIKSSLESRMFETHLIHGVTGSGKTEVYLQAIETALQIGQGVIMLVPEIALTQQTIERFRSRFEGKIAVLHYRLSHGERCDEWHRIRRGEAKVVIGARSAVFSPMPNLGLIIVDEEHEHSYKQGDEMPCYQARDIAVLRGKMNKATVLLGSATPSIESHYNASRGKYKLHTLKARADTASLPVVSIVDMAPEFAKARGFTNFSEKLLEGIKDRWQKGEQVLLFLNRRGYHTTLFCKECKKAVQCQHCDLSLTYHMHENALSCHLCGYRMAPPPKACIRCRSPNPMKFQGVGTELIEKSLQALFPGVRCLRMDADTTRHKGSHQRLLRAFATGKADILIGTQMIAKGLHFPQVTLVGVLNSDASLNMPDFRASEGVFQLLTQVAGRAGRGEFPGEVIIQTFMPDNSTIQLAAAQDYNAFYREEIKIREAFGYPPFSQLVKLLVSGENESQTKAFAEKVRRDLIQKLTKEYEVLPVLPSGYARVKGQYRLQFLVRGPSTGPVSKILENIGPIPKKLRVRIDINPSSTYF